VGVNAYPFISEINGACVGICTEGVSVAPTGDTKEIAQTQTHNTVMARKAVVQETVLADFVKDAKAGSFTPRVKNI
jgi:molybdopterin-containing oxidoreductase family iron-sulfur binding subunit